MGLAARVALAVLLVLLSFPSTNVRAADTSFNTYLVNQHYNNLVSNGDFVAADSMTVGQIQDFLNSRGSCLATVSPSALGVGADGRSAAQIIWDAAQANYPAAQGTSNNYGVSITINGSTKSVSPKAILVTLQKEQSLITDPNRCTEEVLRKAMGYGCPTGGSCNEVYYGFSNQVGWGAWQLRLVYERSIRNAGPARAGQLFNVTDRRLVDNSSCANVAFPLEWLNSSVYLSNHATASLFSYTPHRYCGNYNFWRLGIDWFGFSGSGVGTPDNIDDTSQGFAQMYSGSFKVSTVKASASEVILNGQLIASAGSTSWSFEFVPQVGNITYNFAYRRSGQVVANKLITIERRKNGDINGDERVDLLDLSLLGDSWAVTVTTGDWRNLNPQSDDIVDLLDISIFANSWEG